MARIRTVKPDLFRHETLFEAEQRTKLPLRLAYIGLFTACDRDGRFKWKPKTLKLDVLPYDEIDFSRVLDALATHEFIVKYEFDGEEFGCIPSWENHQVINNRETASTIPSLEESTVCTRHSRDDHASITPLVQVQGEGKGREGKRKGRERESATVSRPEFVDEEIWKDFLKHRKAKNAQVTDRVIDEITKQAQIAGWTLEDALKETVVRNWQTFKADWIKDAGKAMSKQQALEARNDEVARQWLASKRNQT